MSLIEDGACPLDVSTNADHMPLPIVPSDPKARYQPSKEFVDGMIESFKKGGKVPKRVAWEIILGVKDLVMKEKSLVEVEVPKGITCDIVGDSKSIDMSSCPYTECSARSKPRKTWVSCADDLAILRLVSPFRDDKATIRRPHDRFQRRLRRSVRPDLDRLSLR